MNLFNFEAYDDRWPVRYQMMEHLRERVKKAKSGAAGKPRQREEEEAESKANYRGRTLSDVSVKSSNT